MAKTQAGLIDSVQQRWRNAAVQVALINGSGLSADSTSTALLAAEVTTAGYARASFTISSGATAAWDATGQRAVLDNLTASFTPTATMTYNGILLLRAGVIEEVTILGSADTISAGQTLTYTIAIEAKR